MLRAHVIAEAVELTTQIPHLGAEAIQGDVTNGPGRRSIHFGRRAGSIADARFLSEASERIQALGRNGLEEPH